jgi:hypothetical protein
MGRAASHTPIALASSPEATLRSVAATNLTVPRHRACARVHDGRPEWRPSYGPSPFDVEPEADARDPATSRGVEVGR